MASPSHEVAGKKVREVTRLPNLDSMRLQKETGRTGEKGGGERQDSFRFNGLVRLMEDGEKSLNSPPPPTRRLRRSPSSRPASQAAIKSQRTTETKLLHRRRREQSIKCTSGNRGGGGGGRQTGKAGRVRPSRNTPSYWAVFGQILLKRVSSALAQNNSTYLVRSLQSPLIA